MDRKDSPFARRKTIFARGTLRAASVRLRAISSSRFAWSSCQVNPPSICHVAPQSRVQRGAEWLQLFLAAYTEMTVGGPPARLARSASPRTPTSCPGRALPFTHKFRCTRQGYFRSLDLWTSKIRSKTRSNMPSASPRALNRSVFCSRTTMSQAGLRLTGEICELFGFMDFRGRRQLATCLKALRDLEQEGHFVLPPPNFVRHTKPTPRRLPEAVPAPLDVPTAAGEVRGLAFSTGRDGPPDPHLERTHGAGASAGSRSIGRSSTPVSNRLGPWLARGPGVCFGWPPTSSARCSA